MQQDTMTLEEELLSFIKQKMTEQGRTRSELARYMRKSPSTVTKLFSRLDPPGDDDGGDGGANTTKEQRNLKIEDLDQMLRFLGMEFSHDILVARRKVYVKFAPLKGVVAHGLWREREMSSVKIPEKPIEIPSLPIAEFAHLDQYALQVVDSHAEKYVSQNGYIVCLDFLKARGAPKAEDIVVIERQVELPAATRNVTLLERAVRKVTPSEGGFTLTPLTENPAVDSIQYDPSDTKVRITDLVIGTFQLSPNFTF